MKTISIKDEIRNIRRGLDLTQAQFARLFNRAAPRSIKTTRSDITKYETGATDPPAAKYKKFLSLSLPPNNNKKE